MHASTEYARLSLFVINIILDKSLNKHIYTSGWLTNRKVICK